MTKLLSYVQQVLRRIRRKPQCDVAVAKNVQSAEFFARCLERRVELAQQGMIPKGVDTPGVTLIREGFDRALCEIDDPGSRFALGWRFYTALCQLADDADRPRDEIDVLPAQAQDLAGA